MLEGSPVEPLTLVISVSAECGNCRTSLELKDTYIMAMTKLGIPGLSRKLKL